METKVVKNRLSEDDRKEIFVLHEKGVSVSKISEQFKVSRPTIYTILEKVRKDQTKNEFFIDSEDENKDMSNLAIKKNNIPTDFLGIKIDTENGSSNPKIRKALDKSFQLLDIMKFIEVTKFKLNMTMFDYFWQVVVGNRWVHLSPPVLDWFGYEGDIREQKKAFIKMLKRNDISFNELTKDDKRIELFPSVKAELAILNEGAQSCSKFLIMEPNDLKMAIMQLKTKNGHIIRQYYIDLEELLKLYVEYTLYFNHRESQRKITSLEESMAKLNLTIAKQEEDRIQDRETLNEQRLIMARQEQYMRSLGISLEEVKDQNEELLDETKGLKKQNKKIQRKLGIAVEDRAPQPEDETKRERFVLLKRNDPEFMGYYTIRAQDSYTTKKLKTQRTLFPNLVVLLDFKCSPNSKTLYNRIKENLKLKNVTFKNNDIEIEDSQITEEELIDEMKAINDQKYDV
jgi:DNA invertase Pin-like site-specific DNA recombinase